jgi:hypothetical protein
MSLLRVIALACVNAALLAASDSDIDVAVRGVLTRYLQLTTSDLADLQAGKVVKRGLDSTAAGEVGVVGAVRINAPKAKFLTRVRDIVRFKSGPDVVQIGRFSRPPTLDDLAALTVEAADFDRRGCRVGNCGVRLPAAVIQRVEREIDPGAPDVQQRAAVLFKQVLLDDVTAYVNGSPGRFEQYDDGARPIRPLDEFEGVLRSSPALDALVPGLSDHLKTFPAGRLPDADDFLYWSKERVSMSAAFITVTHVTIVCPSAATCVMTTKDVYSSRYLDASLAISVATDSLETPSAFYLVYGNRSRANALKGGFSSLKRAIVERRARGNIEQYLRTLKAQMEKE